MPSIEISLSGDAQLLHEHSNESYRNTMALYHEHGVTEGNLAALASIHHRLLDHHGDCIEYNGHQYHDVIEIHDEMEDRVGDDDSGIFESRRAPNKENTSDDVVNRIRSMIQYNFASRATMSPLDDAGRRHVPRVAVHFVEHRM